MSLENTTYALQVAATNGFASPIGRRSCAGVPENLTSEQGGFDFFLRSVIGQTTHKPFVLACLRILRFDVCLSRHAYCYSNGRYRWLWSRTRAPSASRRNCICNRQRTFYQICRSCRTQDGPHSTSTFAHSHTWQITVFRTCSSCLAQSVSKWLYWRMKKFFKTKQRHCGQSDSKTLSFSQTKTSPSKSKHTTLPRTS
jgi:hypothetical protein